MAVADVAEEMNLVLAGEQRRSDTVNRGVSPPLEYRYQ